MSIQFQLRRNLSTTWTADNPILAEGELGVETDTSRFKIGNGVDSWNSLPYSNDSTGNANSVGAEQLKVGGNGLIGQVLTSDGDGTFSWTQGSTGVSNLDDEDIEHYLLMTRVTSGGLVDSYVDANSVTYNPLSGKLRLENGLDINGTEITSDGTTMTLPQQAAIGDYIMPTADGSVNQIIKTDGAGTLSFDSVDTFGGNRVYVSAEKGNDANDGTTAPVATIKRAAEIASGLVYDGSGNPINNITIMIASGEYSEDNPIIIVDNVAVIGDNLRRTIIRPQNADRDIFRVRNSSYINNVVFKDAVAAGVPDFTFRYAISFDDVTDTSVSRTAYTNLPAARPKIFTSPYVQNCSIISFLGGNGVEIDGDLIDTPNTPPNDLEAENPVDPLDGIPEQGKSMVANAFTILSFGGNAWRVVNDAYAQIVSCFVIFTENGCITQNGGYLSITNSASNFGLFALRASGYSQTAFEFDRGIISSNGISEGLQTLTIVGLNRPPLEQFVLRIRDFSTNADITDNFNNDSSFGITASLTPTMSNVGGNTITFDSAHGFAAGEPVEYDSNGNTEIIGLLNELTYFISVPTSTQIQLFHDENLTKPVQDIRADTTSGTHLFKQGFEQIFVNEVLDSHTNYQTITLPAGTYSITQGDTIQATDGGDVISADIFEYDSGTNQLTVSINLVQEGDNLVRNFFTSASIIDAGEIAASVVNVNSVVNRSDLFTGEISIITTENRPITSIGSTNTQKAYLHRPSIVNSSAHTWEYAGAGTDYNALPQNGGQTDESFEQVSTLPGRVYTSGTNELGDFKVGNFVRAFNRTGTISFKNKVEIGELDSIALSLSAGVVVDQISTDVDLGDNEVGGPANTRLVTQLAARDFINNRLGNFIDQNLSTNAVPNAVLQLNGQGKINAELVQSSSGAAAFQLDTYNSRLFLQDEVPPIDLKSGDIVIEEYQEIVLTTTGAITVSAGDVVEQTTGSGTVKQDVISGTTVRIIQPFSGTFNTSDELTLVGTGSLGANSVPVSVAGPNSVTDNYFLADAFQSQYLVLDPSQSYVFTSLISNSTPVVGAITGAAGIPTDYIAGSATVLDVFNYNTGSGYATPGTYEDIPLTSLTGVGTNATADITVNAAGIVETVDLAFGGSGYAVGDTLSANASDIGGISVSGANFEIDVDSIENRLYVDLVDSIGIAFDASGSSVEFIQDDNATQTTFDQTGETNLGFDSTSQGTGGAVDFSQSEINFNTNHNLDDGDPVIYDSGANTSIGALTNGDTYYAGVIDSTTIELYFDYALVSKVNFTTSGTGTHQLKIDHVNLSVDRFYVSGHALSTGDAVRYDSAAPPTGISNGDYLFVGSVTQNSFTLHANRGSALDSTGGITIAPVNLSADGTSNATLTQLGVPVVNTINSSGQFESSWSNLSATTIDAEDIVSGIISTTRLASATANSETFLRGDSTWSRAVQGFTADAPVTLTGSSFNDGGDTVFYNRVNLKLEDASYNDPLAPSAGTETKGVAAFDFNHFEVDANGKVITKASGSGGVVDAALLAGENSAYYLDPDNLTGRVSVEKGGTNQNAYTQGDILYAATNIGDGTFSDTVSGLTIGSQNDVLTVNASGVPAWSNSVTLNDIQVGVTAANIIDTTTGNLVLNSASGTVEVIGTIDSTTNDTGAFTVDGGVGINGNVNIGGSVDIDSDLAVGGDLTVSGTTTTVNTETILLADNIITLNSNYEGSSPTEDSGIEIERGTETNAQLYWNESADRWVAAGAVTGTFAYTSEIGDATITIDAGAGLATGGSFTTNQSGAATIKIDHADTSSVSNLSSNNSTGTVIQDVSFEFDDYGHVTTATVGTTDLDNRYLTDYTVTESDVTQHESALSITESQITDLKNYLTDYTVTESDVTQHESALSITESQITDLKNYLTSETNTSISFDNSTNTLSYTDENSTTTDIDLSLYLDDTNLARLTSGTVDGSGVATFTRDDNTTFTVDFSSLFDDTNLARITSAGFDDTNGVLTLTRDDASTVTADLDGRYLNPAAPNAEVDNSFIVGNDLTVGLDATISGSLKVGPQSYDLSVENNRVGINVNNPSCVLDVASAESQMEVKFTQPGQTSEFISISFKDSNGDGSSITSFDSKLILNGATVYAGAGFPSSSEQFEVGGNIVAENAEFTGTGAVELPEGTQAERPGTPAAGMLRFNSDTALFEGYNGTEWIAVEGGSSLFSETSAGIWDSPVITTATLNGDLVVSGLTSLQQTTEVLNTKFAPSGVENHDFSTGAIWYHNNVDFSFTANFTNVPTTSNRAINVVLILDQNPGVGIPNAVQIDGVSQTINWADATVPTGTAGQKDIVSFTLIRQNSSWLVLGSLNTFG